MNLLSRLGMMAAKSHAPTGQNGCQPTKDIAYATKSVKQAVWISTVNPSAPVFGQLGIRAIDDNLRK